MDENVEKNMWLKGRRDLYSKMMFKEIRDAREQRDGCSDFQDLRNQQASSKKDCSEKNIIFL